MCNYILWQQTLTELLHVTQCTTKRCGLGLLSPGAALTEQAQIAMSVQLAEHRKPFGMHLNSTRNASSIIHSAEFFPNTKALNRSIFLITYTGTYKYKLT